MVEMTENLMVGPMVPQMADMKVEMRALTKEVAEVVT